MKTYLASGRIQDIQDIQEGRSKMNLYLAASKTGGAGGPESNALGASKSKGMRLYQPPARSVESQIRPIAQAALKGRPLRLLLSYHFYKNVDVDELFETHFPGVALDIFADSGAFSVWTSGATIDMNDYAAWLRRWAKRLTVAAALDVIGDAAKSLTNTHKLRDMVGDVVEVMPVFHANDGSWSWLEAYLKADYGYIGFAPNSLRRSDPGLIDPWCRKSFEYVTEKTRIHGFGMTRWDLMRDLPWHSCDSSSWTSGFRFAGLTLFDQSRGRMVKLDMRDRKDLLPHAALLRSYSIRPTQVLNKGYDRDLLTAVLVESWQRAEEWLCRHRARRTAHV